MNEWWTSLEPNYEFIIFQGDIDSHLHPFPGDAEKYSSSRQRFYNLIFHTLTRKLFRTDDSKFGGQSTLCTPTL